MAQTIRPSADLDNTGVWTTAPLFSDINGVVGSDDGDFVVSDGTPSTTEPFTVQGTFATDPTVSTGHILRLRASKASTGGADYDAVCELRQAYISEASQGTLIATVTITALTDTTATTGTTNLSDVEADTITDYSKLCFRHWGAKNGGGANRGVRVYDVELEIPDVPVTTRNRAIITG